MGIGGKVYNWIMDILQRTAQVRVGVEYSKIYTR